MKGLLIAYSFAPQMSVGALRPSYWAEESAGSTTLSFDVVTATPGSSEGFKRFHVPLQGKSIWSFLIRDEGLRWSKDLAAFFKTLDVSAYDFVLYSGGPFWHFHTAKYFKKKGLKVYFDFRDPFSYNPRFNERGIKKRIKQRYERNCLRYADAIISVNEQCHDFIGPGNPTQRWIIPNGYDERKIPNKSTAVDPGTVFYGGKFYWEPTQFFEALQAVNGMLVHAGAAPFFDHPFLTGEDYRPLGMLTQKELYLALRSCEIGLVFTIDVPFESTTKIYDYMALGKKILVVTLGEPNVGVLKRELDEYPCFRWVRHEKDEIIQALRELSEMPMPEFDAHGFSRKAGLEVLTQKITQDAGSSD